MRHLEVPVPGVLVIFYNLGDSSLTRLRTADDGTFVLASAPAGVYDLIAYKRGFEPALQRLWHQAASEQISAVSIALLRKDGKLPATAPPATMWDLRGRLPGDVLRELGLEALDEDGNAPEAPAIAAADRVPLSRLVNGEVRTMTDVAAQSTTGSLSRAEVGLHGGLPNGWSYGIAGDYAMLGDADQPGELTTGNAAGLALKVAPSAAEQLYVSTRRNTSVVRRQSREPPGSLGELEPRRRVGQSRIRRARATSKKRTSIVRPLSARRCFRWHRARGRSTAATAVPPRTRRAWHWG